MVERTLAFARGIAISETPETIELGKFLKDLKSDMLEDFQLEVGAPLDVRLRPQSMRRALRNVIENAIRYGGKAEVTYKRENERAVIEIRDYGTGIPNELLEDVFEPFFRVEASRSRETGGTGLGLSISRAILRSHGGDATIMNHPGGGILASLSLPLSQNFEDQEILIS